MTKAQFRNKYKQLRKQLSTQEQEDLSLNIANQLLTLDIWNRSVYHIFLSIKEHSEVNTDYILNILAGKDKNVVISQCNFSTITMTHYLLTDNTLIKKNKFNVPEPTGGFEIPSDKIEVVFVPLLAFDKKGHRIGYGKGFYDRFLAECHPKTLKIGLSYFEAEDYFEDTHINDITLDYCVTPQLIYRFH